MKFVRWTLAVLLLSGVAGGAWFWRVSRSPAIPTSDSRVLFQGIHYRREVLRQPRPLVVHILRVNLRAPGIAFLVTPAEGSAPLPLKARTTSEFLEKYSAQVAVNGDFFAPWHSRFLWDYYPHRGDPVQVDGMAVSNGLQYSVGKASSPVLAISEENRAELFDSPTTVHKKFPASRIHNAISGNTMLIRDGRPIPAARWYKDHGDLHPRTAIGLNKTRDQLIVLIVDGRQAGYSEGASLKELAHLLLEHGADTAINLDGGGSATLATQANGGAASVLNSPIDNRIPGRERPIANHLAIFAQQKAAGS